MTIADRALEFINEGDVVGLGSGRAATAFLHRLAVQVQAGLRICAVPTSDATAERARQLGIATSTLAETLPVDITIDGADEVDPQFNLIKGFGGALVREKIVAAASRRLVVLVGPEDLAEKLVSVLGTRGNLPIEVVPFGVPLCRQCLLDMGLPPLVRLADSRP